MERSKEIPNQEQIAGVKPVESPVLTDLEQVSKEPLPREVKTWMEKVESNQTQQQSVTDDQTGQVVLTPVAPSNPVVVLPISRQKFTTGFKKTVDDAGRWLSEFFFRLIKINKGKVTFKEE